MKKLSLKRERVNITMQPIEMGDDLCIIITGGSKPHIGCVTLSTPRESLSDKSITSATTSILNLVGHKDDEVAKYVSNKLSAALNKNVAVCCGIHIDNIKEYEISAVMEISEELTEMLIDDLLHKDFNV